MKGVASVAGAVLGAVLLAFVLGACGSDGGATADGPPAQGADLARSLGCSSCHSTNGDRKQGPTWQGLAGSEVTLDDGSTVTADAAYLTRSITDPGDEVVDGYIPIMPDLNVSDADVAALVAYIQELPR